MNYETALRRIANCYYNMGLERARLRDLSGAAELLKKSLLFDKYQKDARNLLGLIFYECGETADALVQWVISMNLVKKDNIADHYLDEVQRKPAILKICSDNVRRFNQALDYAKNNNEDLAILQLNQVISDKPNYIKAQILIALLYMKREEWVKAGRSLYRVLKIDRNNPKALVLMDEVKSNTGRREVEQSRLKNVFSHKQMMSDDDVMLPQGQRNISPWTSFGLILAGVVLALFTFYFLILPDLRTSMNARNNQEIMQYTEKLDSANQNYADLKEKYDSVSQQYESAQAALDQSKSTNDTFMQQYQTLNKINSEYSSGDLISAATDYINLDQSTITDENMVALLNSVKSYMEGSVYQTLADMGTSAWNAGNLDQAEQYYKLSIGIREEPANMYLLGRLYYYKGDKGDGNAIFDKIVGEHPDSPYAERSRKARGY